MDTATHIYVSEIDSPIGPLSLAATERGLCSIDFGPLAEKEAALLAWAKRRLGPAALERDDRRLAQAAQALNRYFSGASDRFELPLDLRGTPFQVRVWNALCAIPYGETRSYGDIAAAIGQAKAVRAVGGANNRNPLPIIVPCHRVIGADGRLVGYGGGMDIKVRLLQLEGALSPI